VEGLEEPDKDLKAFDGMRIRWRPEWIDSIFLTPFSLNFVMGPRQVGKTTGIKLLIEELLKDRDRGSVFYLDCDLISDLRELRSALDFYRRFRAREGLKSSFIFLDEVTGIEGWWRVIKGYVDAEILSEDVVTVLGSASFRLKKFLRPFLGEEGWERGLRCSP